MKRSEYMKRLTHCLRRLPKEDYYRAVEYFEEYFDEAGPENEEQAIRDLGDPEDAAKALIMDLAVRNAKEPPKTVKRGFSAVWIGILAVFAAPVAIPLALAAVIILLTLLAVAACIILCVVLTAVCVCAMGVLSVVGGAALLFQSFADGLSNIGIGLFFAGIGILIVYGAAKLFLWIVRKIAAQFGKMMKGGEKK